MTDGTRTPEHCGLLIIKVSAGSPEGLFSQVPYKDSSSAYGM